MFYSEEYFISSKKYQKINNRALVYLLSVGYADVQIGFSMTKNRMPCLAVSCILSAKFFVLTPILLDILNT